MNYITYRKYLDGYYTGSPIEYMGLFELNGSFSLFENGCLLVNLPCEAKLNEHYTKPEVMPLYNLASQLISEGEL